MKSCWVCCKPDSFQTLHIQSKKRKLGWSEKRCHEWTFFTASVPAPTPHINISESKHNSHKAPLSLPTFFLNEEFVSQKHDSKRHKGTCFSVIHLPFLQFFLPITRQCGHIIPPFELLPQLLVLFDQPCRHLPGPADGFVVRFEVIYRIQTEPDGRQRRGEGHMDQEMGFLEVKRRDSYRSDCFATTTKRLCYLLCTGGEGAHRFTTTSSNGSYTKHVAAMSYKWWTKVSTVRFNWNSSGPLLLNCWRGLSNLSDLCMNNDLCIVLHLPVISLPVT